jgi:hypothetical protein
MFYVRSFTNDPSLVPVGQINWAASGASREGTFPSTSLPSLVNILQAVSEKMEM